MGKRNRNNAGIESIPSTQSPDVTAAYDRFVRAAYSVVMARKGQGPEFRGYTSENRMQHVVMSAAHDLVLAATDLQLVQLESDRNDTNNWAAYEKQVVEILNAGDRNQNTADVPVDAGTKEYIAV